MTLESLHLIFGFLKIRTRSSTRNSNIIGFKQSSLKAQRFNSVFANCNRFRTNYIACKIEARNQLDRVPGLSNRNFND